MYRERFKFAANGASLDAPAIPPGKVKFDDTFQKNVETYHHGVEIRIPVEGKGPFTLTATGQGCADKGLCYPPQDATVRLVAGEGAGAAPQMSVPSVQSAAPQFPLPGQGAPQLDTPGAQHATPAAPNAQDATPAANAIVNPAAAPAASPSELSGIAALLHG